MSREFFQFYLDHSILDVRADWQSEDADAVETTLLCSRSLAIELHVIAAGIDYVWLADSDYSVSWLNGPVAYHHLLPWGAPARCVSLYL